MASCVPRRADSLCLRMARSRNYAMLQKSLMVSGNSDSVAVMRFAVEAGDDGAASITTKSSFVNTHPENRERRAAWRREHPEVFFYEL
jgi:hypothetical protein